MFAREAKNNFYCYYKQILISTDIAPRNEGKLHLKGCSQDNKQLPLKLHWLQRLAVGFPQYDGTYQMILLRYILS